MLMMKIRLSTYSGIPGFSASTGKDWGANYGRPEMQSYIEREIMPRINAEAADGWTLVLSHNFVRTNFFCISKRGRNYLADKEKVVGIITPIPDCKPATPWGGRQNKLATICPVDPKDFFLVPFDYADYGSIKEYVMDCTYRGLHDLFERGYVLGGEKIRFVK
jgi:hypothetical protein